MNLTEKIMPEVLDEAKGIASGSGVDLSDIMALNCRYEILNHPQNKTNQVNNGGQECTIYAILSEAMENNRILFGQNWDYRPFTLKHTLL